MWWMQDNDLIISNISSLSSIKMHQFILQIRLNLSHVIPHLLSIMEKLYSSTYTQHFTLCLLFRYLSTFRVLCRFWVDLFQHIILFCFLCKILQHDTLSRNIPLSSSSIEDLWEGLLTDTDSRASVKNTSFDTHLSPTTKTKISTNKPWQPSSHYEASDKGSRNFPYWSDTFPVTIMWKWPNSGGLPMWQRAEVAWFTCVHFKE